MPVPKLQLALDTFDLPSALGPLQRAHSYIDVIEVGTILCLSEGMSAVRAIRSLFPDKIILADVRIAEAGGVISRMAFEAGANWVTVVSGASKTTSQVVFEEAQRHGGDVQIELTEGWTWDQARAWRDLGIGQVITHRSRDAEAHGVLTWDETDFEQIRQLAAMGFKVTVTGGVEVADIPRFAGVPVYIFIAGRAIRGAADPAEAARRFQDTIAATFAGAQGQAS